MGVERQRNRRLPRQGLDAVLVNGVVENGHFIPTVVVDVHHCRVDVEIHILEIADVAHQVQHFHHRRLVDDGLTRVQILDFLFVELNIKGIWVGIIGAVDLGIKRDKGEKQKEEKVSVFHGDCVL